MRWSPAQMENGSSIVPRSQPIRAESRWAHAARDFGAQTVTCSSSVLSLRNITPASYRCNLSHRHPKHPYLLSREIGYYLHGCVGYVTADQFAGCLVGGRGPVEGLVAFPAPPYARKMSTSAKGGTCCDQNHSVLASKPRSQLGISHGPTSRSRF